MLSAWGSLELAMAT